VRTRQTTGQLLIGTQGWNYDAWVGSFYPKATRPPDYLRVYARAFRTVEIDSTFYGIPSVATVEHWAERVPDGFVFAPKMPQAITHERKLRDAEEILAAFAARVRLLGRKLGPVLVQLGPEFGADRRAALEGFLPHLPGDIRFAVEFRRPEWIEPSLLHLLADHKVALALVDGRWLPRDLMVELAKAPTTDFAYVRWMGPDRAIEDYSRVLVDREHEIAEWAAALAELAARVSVVHGYFNNHYQGHSPASARALQRLVGQRPVEPEELSEQVELFP
jgi:uncharacterized protein YecE (DUF72 family)